ncbi:MAG: SPOR domain-containing protein [Thermodesulfobacteriota bacterium]
MTKLKPQLIVAGPNKKKGGFASGIGYFLVLIIVFVLGVYLGMRVDNPNFTNDQMPQSAQNETIQDNNSYSMDDEIVALSQNDNSVQDPRVSTPDTTSTYYKGRVQPAQKERNDSPFITEDAQDNEGVNTPLLIAAQESTDNLNNGLQVESLDVSLVDQDTYRLQVAAFGSIDQANEVTNELRLKGYDAYIVTSSNSRGEVWNLIKVGKFKTAQEAWNYAALYQSNEGGEVFVESLNKGRVYNESLEDNKETLSY